MRDAAGIDLESPPDRSTAAARGLLPEVELVARARAGEAWAFGALYERHYDRVLGYLYRQTLRVATAEELTSDAFYAALRGLVRFRGEAPFGLWLYRIATNLGVNYARDNRHERNASTIYLDETDSETGTTPDVADATPGAESNLLRRERVNAIRDHVMALPERQRMAVLMHKYEDMDYRQIGEVLKLSESATKSLLFRAYQTLREKLKPFV